MNDRDGNGGDRIWRAVRFTLVLVLLAAGWRGLGYARAWVESRPGYLVDPGCCRLLGRPSWTTLADVQSIRRDSGLSGHRYSFLAPGLSDRLSRGFARSPWVRRVRAVRLRYPNRVDLDLELETPAAAVPVAGRYYLVNAEGRRLPGARAELPEVLDRSLVILRGVRAPLPAAGEIWSRAVREGAAVARDLRRLPAKTYGEIEPAIIDVSNVAGRRDRARPEIALRTARGVTIEWHHSSSSPRAFLDPPLARKLLHLVRANREYPGLRGLRIVRVQFDALYVVEEAAHVRGG